MKISYRKIDYKYYNSCKLLAKWHNDKELGASISVRRKKKSENPIYTAATIRKRGLENAAQKTFAREFFVEMNGKKIGYASLMVNPPHRMCKDKNIIWPSLWIASRRMRRKGIGTAIGKHIIKLAKKHGASHIEAGVFEFNFGIRKMLEKYGFESIGRVEKFVWYKNRYWADVRYLRAID